MPWGYSPVLRPKRLILDQVRQAHAVGLTDRRAALALGLHRTTVAHYRRALGLPPHPTDPAVLSEAARRAARTRCRRNPVSGRHARSRRRALAAGWPPGCTEAQARVLAAVEAGADRPARVAALTGRSRHRVAEHLAHCRAQGWVVRTGGASKAARYSLAPAVAMARQRHLARLETA